LAAAKPPRPDRKGIGIRGSSGNQHCVRQDDNADEALAQEGGGVVGDGDRASPGHAKRAVNADNSAVDHRIGNEVHDQGGEFRWLAEPVGMRHVSDSVVEMAGPELFHQRRPEPGRRYRDYPDANAG
jgi:hypothetical protein